MVSSSTLPEDIPEETVELRARITKLKALVRDHNTKERLLGGLEELDYDLSQFDGLAVRTIISRIRDKINLLISIEEEDELDDEKEQGIHVPNTPDKGQAFETQLKPDQVDWVKRKLENAYHSSRSIFIPLLSAKGVPKFPSKIAVLRSVLQQLTRESVVHMMRVGGFGFHIKLATPGSAFPLLIRLINEQPKLMNTTDQNQQDLLIRPRDQEHLMNTASEDEPSWEWEFYEAEQVPRAKTWDDPMSSLGERAEGIRKNRPLNCLGTDVGTWAAATANGLRIRRPLDAELVSHNKPAYRAWGSTILDEEGGEDEEGPFFLVATFLPANRYPYLYRCHKDTVNPHAYFRDTISGPLGEE